MGTDATNGNGGGAAVTSPWPVDLALLRKGHTFTAEALETILGVPQHDPEFRHELLHFRSEFERLWERQRRELVTLTESGTTGGLHICTDAEADIENAERVRLKVRGLQRDLCRHRSIDATNLPPEQADGFERRRRYIEMVARGAVAGAKESLKLNGPRAVIPHRLSVTPDAGGA